MMKPYRVGLTGGIGSGKSETASCFQKLGIDVLDADQIARDLITPQTRLFQSELLEQLWAYFLKRSPDIRRADGSLDRRILREWIFQHAPDRHWLEQLLHPPITATLIEMSESCTSPYVIWMVPLLIENPTIRQQVQRILLVDADPTLQAERVMKRDQLTRETALTIMSHQAAPQLRRKAADDILINNRTFRDLEQEVRQLHFKYLGYSDSLNAK